MNTNMRWVLYARKSTESEDRQIQSIDDQVGYLTEVARKEKLYIEEIICEAKSAKEPDVRVEFNRLLSLIERGKVHGILCWKLDRLSRNPIDSARIQWFLQTGKIKCIKASDRSYWPEDNALLFAVEQGMANQYVRDLAKNVKRGLESKADKGWYPSIPPLGYLNSKKGEKSKEEIIVDPERFLIVRKMWDLMLTGNYTAMEVLRIATNEWKLDTPKRRQVGKRPIVPNYIYKIFSNIFYTGNFIYAGRFHQGNHTPMITMDEFDRMQSILGKKGQPRPKTHEFAFTGIMKCANCGASITASEKKKLVKSTGEFKTYTYYHCTRRVGVDSCKMPPVTLSNLENQVKNLLAEYAIAPEFYEYGISILKANEGKDIREYEIAYEKQLQHVKDLQRKIERLLGFLLNETISEEEYNTQKKELEQKLGIEKVKLGQCEIRCVDYNRLVLNAFTFSRESLNAFEKGGLQTQKDVLSNLGSNHRLNNKNLCIDLHSWLEILKTGESELLPKIERLELERGNNDKTIIPSNRFSLLLCHVRQLKDTENGLSV